MKIDRANFKTYIHALHVMCPAFLMQSVDKKWETKKQHGIVEENVTLWNCNRMEYNTHTHTHIHWGSPENRIHSQKMSNTYFWKPKLKKSSSSNTRNTGRHIEKENEDEKKIRSTHLPTIQSCIFQLFLIFASVFYLYFSHS